MSRADETVTLRGGVTVTLPAFQLLMSLESKGCTVALTSKGALVIRPRASLTDADIEAIREHRHGLVALVTYSPPEPN